jgi:hypothetical protein
LSVHYRIPPSTAYRKCISYNCPLWFTIECHDLPENEVNVAIKTAVHKLWYRNCEDANILMIKLTTTQIVINSGEGSL